MGGRRNLSCAHNDFAISRGIDTLGPTVKSWFRQFFQLCWQEKKWWLIPLLVLLLLGLAAVFLLASNSGISWALYPSK